MITYCIEKLYHFRCHYCQEWWTIGDWQIKEILTCPHCNHQAMVFKEKTDSYDLD